MSTSKKSKGGGNRDLSVKVKTAKGRKLSSTRWLQRQLNDPYVADAKRDGYRSRAAYKLIEIDDKYALLKPGMTVVDLGCAPGSWTQIGVQRIKSLEGEGRIIGLDLIEVEPIPGADLIVGDFLDEQTLKQLEAFCAGRDVDLVMSDMAPATTGHKSTDHLRIMALCEAALYFAYDCLAPNGTFLAKVFQGGTEADLLADMKKRFKTIRHIKPKASRADSSELYVLATGFCG